MTHPARSIEELAQQIAGITPTLSTLLHRNVEEQRVHVDERTTAREAFRNGNVNAKATMMFHQEQLRQAMVEHEKLCRLVDELEQKVRRLEEAA